MNCYALLYQSEDIVPSLQPKTPCEDAMKPLLILLLFGLAVLSPAAGFCAAPSGIAGFYLGKQLEAYESQVKYDTLFPLRHSKFINEIEINAPEGFKNGLLWVGNCAQPGKIMRIRLKYADSSKKFYNELLKRFKQKFGEPDEWQGDPFHIVIAWKWSFSDDKGNRISLVLQHNTRDEEESIGNTVKMTMWNLVEAERECYREKASTKSKKKKSAKKSPPPLDQLIPQ